MTASIVNVAGVALIALIVWWFWVARPKARRAAPDAVVEIVVADGVYTPARIEVPAGRPTVLRFLRRDPSPCAQTVVMDALGVSAELPLNRPVELTVRPPAPGEYEFSCQMRMYRGALVAR